MKYRAPLRSLTLSIALLVAYPVFASGQILFHDGLQREQHDCMLSGVVIGAIQNHQVRDVRIELYEIDTRRLVATTNTRANGSFELRNIPRGEYIISALSGLNQVEQPVTVMGMSSSVTLQLPGEAAGSAQGAMVSVNQLNVPKKARDLLKKSQKALREKKLEKAKGYVEEALKISPDFAEALTLRAILYMEERQLEPATKLLEKATSTDRGYGLGFIALGTAYNLLSRFDDALRVLQRGLSLAPRSWQGYFEKARALLNKGEFKPALEEANKAVELAPKEFGPVYLVRGHANLGLKDYPAAMEDLENFLGRDPSGADPAEARRTLEEVRSFTAQTVN